MWTTDGRQFAKTTSRGRIARMRLVLSGSSASPSDCGGGAGCCDQFVLDDRVKHASGGTMKYSANEVVLTSERHELVPEACARIRVADVRGPMNSANGLQEVLAPFVVSHLACVRLPSHWDTIGHERLIRHGCGGGSRCSGFDRAGLLDRHAAGTMSLRASSLIGVSVPSAESRR